MIPVIGNTTGGHKYRTVRHFYHCKHMISLVHKLDYLCLIVCISLHQIIVNTRARCNAPKRTGTYDYSIIAVRVHRLSVHFPHADRSVRYLSYRSCVLNYSFANRLYNATYATEILWFEHRKPNNMAHEIVSPTGLKYHHHKCGCLVYF